MKIILAAALTLAAFAALRIKAFKKKNGIILAMYAMGMILFFAVYNIRTIKNMITFYHPFAQSMYQPEFFAGGEYPDAFLDEFFDGRTVYTPDDAYDMPDDYEEAKSFDLDEDGNYWVYRYYHAVNMWEYLKFNGADVVKDESLNGLVLTGEQKNRFEDLGIANDMMRYTFALSPYTGELGNGFYYYWFYNSFISESHVYVCPEKIQNAKELVVLWQHDNHHDTDSYYIAEKHYFDEVIAK